MSERTTAGDPILAFVQVYESLLRIHDELVARLEGVPLEHRSVLRGIIEREGTRLATALAVAERKGEPSRSWSPHDPLVPPM